MHFPDKAALIAALVTEGLEEQAAAPLTALMDGAVDRARARPRRSPRA